MADETTVSIEIKLNTESLVKADAMMRIMLNALELEHLELIKEAKVKKVISEIEMSSEAFQEGTRNGN